jgi:hypothetical protein
MPYEYSNQRPPKPPLQRIAANIATLPGLETVIA